MAREIISIEAINKINGFDMVFNAFPTKMKADPSKENPFLMVFPSLFPRPELFFLTLL